jgi:hypothetical protein
MAAVDQGDSLHKNARWIGWALPMLLIVWPITVIAKGTKGEGPTAATLSPVLAIFGALVMIGCIWVILWLVSASFRAPRRNREDSDSL